MARKIRDALHGAVRRWAAVVACCALSVLVFCPPAGAAEGATPAVGPRAPGGGRGGPQWHPRQRPANHPAPGERRMLVIAATSDLHGWITRRTLFPEEPPGGLAHLAPLIAGLRREAPGLILLDGGDTLQGAPNLTWLRLQDSSAPPPVLRLMNRLGYEAMAAGNHDLEQGPQAMRRWRGQSDFPWLAANMVDGEGAPVLPPYRIIERDGLRVGVLGLITPGTPAWVAAAYLEGWRFQDMLATAHRWLPVLRGQERADVVVGLVHGGLDGGYDRRVAVGEGLALPNGAGILADRAPGFDLIVSGHSHQLAPRTLRNGESSYAVPVVQPGAHGEALAVVRMRLESAAGRWRVTGVERETRLAAAEPDSAALEAAAPVLKETGAWLDAATAVRFAAVPPREGFTACAGGLSHLAATRLAPARLERAEGAQGPADAAAANGARGAFSLLPLLWRYLPPEAGELGAPVRRRHLYRWMPYGNPLVLARITPRQIGLLLGPYARLERELRTRYSGVLHPGGLTPRIAPNGTEVLAVIAEGEATPLPPHDPVPVWLTGYHWNGGAGLAARALLHPAQAAGRTRGTLRELVFALLADPRTPLPAACRGFLARRG